MDRALVVLERHDRGRALLREAGELAGGVGAELDVLTLMTAEEFAERAEKLDAMAQGENTSYDDNVVFEQLHNDAAELTESELEGVDVDWQVIAGRIGDSETEADRILTAAEDNDVDHVFITGRQRSPTGKAVFGDRAQSIILNFDGPVTTLLQ